MITHVAIRQDGITYSLPKPNRHHDVIQVIGTSKVVYGEQGFLTDQGQFLGRIGAGQYALDCGQIKELKWPPNLFSEDLW